MDLPVKPVIPTTCGEKTAIFSVIAPVLAIGLYVANVVLMMPPSWYTPVLAGTAIILIWAGLLSAIVGLVHGIRGRGVNVVLYALTGFLLNGCILASAFGIKLPFTQGVAGRSDKTAVLQLNAIPQVYENSVTVIDSKHGFRFELPAGFVKNPNPATSLQTIQSFVRYAENGSPIISVNIDRLWGILPPRKDKPSIDELEEVKKEIRKYSPYAALVKVEQGQWKSRTLDIFLFEMPDKTDMISSWSVKVPLANEAILIKVSGLKDNEGQYRKVLAYILKSLQGASNWD